MGGYVIRGDRTTFFIKQVRVFLPLHQCLRKRTMGLSKLHQSSVIGIDQFNTGGRENAAEPLPPYSQLIKDETIVLACLLRPNRLFPDLIEPRKPLFAVVR